MVDQFINQIIPRFLEQGYWFSFLLIFLGGILTSISPCILSMIPVTVGYIGGYAQESKKQGFILSLAFVLGLAVTFAIFGVIAAAFGKIIGQLGSGWYYFMAAVAVIMGLNLLGVININYPSFANMPVKAKGPGGAFVVGLLFGLVASPCATPVLAVIMAFVVTKGQLWYGAALLFFYGLGHGLPLLVVGTFTATIKNLPRLQRWSHYVTIFSGILLIGLGFYFLALARW